jgi:hypothetical protein
VTITIAERLKATSIMGEDKHDEGGKYNDEEGSNDETGDEKDDDDMAIMARTTIMTN